MTHGDIIRPAAVYCRVLSCVDCSLTMWQPFGIFCREVVTSNVGCDADHSPPPSAEVKDK
jgi:hypothetical protein